MSASCLAGNLNEEEELRARDRIIELLPREVQFDPHLERTTENFSERVDGFTSGEHLFYRFTV